MSYERFLDVVGELEKTKGKQVDGMRRIGSFLDAIEHMNNKNKWSLSINKAAK